METDTKNIAEKAQKHMDEVVYKSTLSNPKTALGFMAEHLLNTTGTISLESLKAGFEANLKGEIKVIMNPAAQAVLDYLEKLPQPSS